MQLRLSPKLTISINRMLRRSSEEREGFIIKKSLSNLERCAHNLKVAGSTGQAILSSSRYKKRKSLSKDGGFFAFSSIDIRYSALSQEHPVFGKIPQTNFLAPSEPPVMSGNSE